MKKYIQLLVIISPFFGFAQESVYLIDKNKVAEYALEVYSNCPKYAEEPYHEDYLFQISQVEIFKIDDESALNQYKLLSTVDLKNKCNSSLIHDVGENFLPENFNPLKYFFPFYNAKPTIYRVDGTNYVVRIKGK